MSMYLWAGTGKQTQVCPDNPPRHQWRRMLGAMQTQPNLRRTPQVFNPFSITTLDAYLESHTHQVHLDRNVAAAMFNKLALKTPLMCPQAVVNQWLAWGVPVNRVKVVHPGDSFKVKDIKM